MRDLIYKVMPWVAGTFLGWMLWHPPAWLDSLGPLAFVVQLALVGLLLIGIVSIVIIANLPARVEMTPVDEETVHAELRELGRQIEQLGFRPAGPPRRVKMAPSAIVLGYAHETEPVYGTAFRTETLPAKLGSDFVSILHGDKGGLTTNAAPEGAALPAGDGGLRQVFPGAPLEELYHKHLDGIVYLWDRGISCRPISADLFAQDLAFGIGRQREVFTASPLRGTLVTLWRAATKRVPFIGPLRDQAVAETQISRLLVS
jgi:hypothetical protein